MEQRLLQYQEEIRLANEALVSYCKRSEHNYKKKDTDKERSKNNNHCKCRNINEYVSRFFHCASIYTVNVLCREDLKRRQIF